MNRSRFFRAAGVVLPALALIGCGGETSGVTNGYPSAPSNVGNPAGPGVNGGNSMAAMAVGQTWTYAVSGNITQQVLNGTTVQTISGAVTNGKIVRAVTAAPASFGSGVFQLTDTFTYTLQGYTPSVQVWTEYVTQGSGGTISLAGFSSQGLIPTLSTRGAIVPGSFAKNTTLSNSSALNFNEPVFLLTFNNPSSTGNPPSVTYGIGAGSGTIQTSFAALAQQQVPSTSGGAYTAWTTESSTTEYLNVDALYKLIALEQPPGTNFVQQASTTFATSDDWVPSMGVPVRSHLVKTESDTVATAYSYTTGSFTAPPSITYTFLANPLVTKEDLQLSFVSAG